MTDQAFYEISENGYSQKIPFAELQSLEIKTGSKKNEQKSFNLRFNYVKSYSTVKASDTYRINVID